MTLKQFKIVKILVVIGLSILVSQSIFFHSPIWAIMGIACATIFLLYCRGFVKEIIADERDYEIGGKAARIAMQIFCWFATALMIIFYSQHDLNPMYEPIAIILAYSVCFLMLVYVLIFRFYDKIIFLKDKMIYQIVGIIILIILIIFGIRLLSGEDDWICQNGQWIKHGNPSFPAPSIECNN